MPNPEVVPEETWKILLVEDDDTVRGQVREYLDGRQIAGRKLKISEYSSLEDALNVIAERKADVIILDVYSGEAKVGGEMIGLEILEKIKKTGFVPVILYTALPRGLEEEVGPFVRLVEKDVGSLGRIENELKDLFSRNIPQVHRAIVTHFDRTLCAYMWEFVDEHWEEFSAFLDKPEFLRLIVQRLAKSFAREGVDKISSEIYGVTPAEDVGIGKVHPAEYYIKPPIGSNPRFGDLRFREIEGKREYLVVLWPSCDMVDEPPQVPKTRKVLCARAIPTQACPKVTDWIASDSNTKKEPVERLVKNNQPRFHFLPGVWDIPNTIVDFQDLEHLPLDELKNCGCLGTIDSPFAESLGERFRWYMGRIGTPDLVVNDAMNAIKEQQDSPEQ